MTLQRHAQNTGAETASAFQPAVHQMRGSPGQPLDASTRSFMEPRFGRDLSQVRVHTDENAADSAHAMQARAFTVGQDVAFARGQYSPGTKEGEHLIAHEVAHTIQQSEAPTGSPGPLEASSPHENSEHTARTAATQISSGGTASVQTGSPVKIAREIEHGGKREGLFDRAKATVYSGLISSLRGPQQHLLADLRRQARLLPEEARAEIESIIDQFELITDILISLVEAIVAVVGGLITGLIGLFVGLFHLVSGILQALYVVSQGIVTGDYRPALKWFKELGQTLKNIPAALKALIASWFQEFNTASTDRQTIMIGELTGQIIAILLPAALTGGGAAAGEAGEGVGDLSQVLEGVSRTTSTGRRLVSVSSKAETVSDLTAASRASTPGQLAGDLSTASRASTPVVTFPQAGGAALKPVLQAAAEEAPVVAPAAVPAAVSAAAPATQTSHLAKVVKAVSTAAHVATAVKEGEKEQKKKQCGDPELPWTQASWTGTDRGQRMVANPLTRCGVQGSDPTIHLPGWRCIQNAPKPADGSKEIHFWVHAHLLHGRDDRDDLHGPGNDPRNLIITDKSLNGNMSNQVEQPAIQGAHYRDETFSYTVTPHYMAESGDKSYFADSMQITLQQIDPVSRRVLRTLYNGPVRSSDQRNPPGNCT